MTSESKVNLGCRICGGTKASGNYEAREMKFGLRTAFQYWQCAECGSLWLRDPPKDISVYYPPEYHKLDDLIDSSDAITFFRRYLRHKRNNSYFQTSGGLGSLLVRWRDDLSLRALSALVNGLGRQTRILDVGCGSGKLLLRLREIGFECLTGVDPFVPRELDYENGVVVRKRNIEELEGMKFDVVMFHHSLEHIANPMGTIATTVRLLAPRGKCLVRLPVVAHAWEKYKTNWVQLDPPRHLWLPTERAMRTLAESVGLRVAQVDYDSTDFQFWGSELCVQDVPLKEAEAMGVDRLFAAREMKKFRAAARALNRESQGDQAAFILAQP